VLDGDFSFIRLHFSLNHPPIKKHMENRNQHICFTQDQYYRHRFTHLEALAVIGAVFSQIIRYGFYFSNFDLPYDFNPVKCITKY